MKVVIGSDHAGYELKEVLKKHLEETGYVVLDVGTNSTQPVDYPDYAEAVGRAVVGGKGERGLLICGSGVGASIAANKIAGVRAAVCHDAYSAAQGVEHDDMNILVLGGRVIGEALALTLGDAFLGAKFSGEERHIRRLNKIVALEAAGHKNAGSV